jgi:hypothetical protein
MIRPGDRLGTVPGRFCVPVVAARGNGPGLARQVRWYLPHVVRRNALFVVPAVSRRRAAVGQLLRAPTVSAAFVDQAPAASDSSTSPFASGFNTPQEMKRSVRVVGDSS